MGQISTSANRVELKQLKSRLVAAVAALPPTLRRVIQSHYLQQMAFEEVAEGMALTRGRISQIHKEALEKLRALLTGSGEIELRC